MSKVRYTRAQFEEAVSTLGTMHNIITQMHNEFHHDKALRASLGKLDGCLLKTRFEFENASARHLGEHRVVMIGFKPEDEIAPPRPTTQPALEDPWEPRIAMWAKDRDADEVTTEAALAMLDPSHRRWTRADADRVCSIFRKLGYARRRTGPRNARIYTWHVSVGQSTEQGGPF